MLSYFVFLYHIRFLVYFTVLIGVIWFSKICVFSFLLLLSFPNPFYFQLNRIPKIVMISRII